LAKLDKGHTRAGFEEALALMCEAGLALAPTFIPFTPWTTWRSYREFLRALVELDLAGVVAPVQLAIRLLIPEGSRLLDLPEVRGMVHPFDPRALVYPWRHEDATLDEFVPALQEMIKREDRRRTPRFDVFRKVWEMVEAGPWPDVPRVARATIPYL